eukprot:TRINITY_DN36320_c0_g1_i1.p2 TRINITY_DN36320_c0_g1~~TRINITY_DN36320_c0_g1_i1.p2  ORF type:complete len:129 (-),score=32.83 TRINITY_DN36320_c0_g1_i1:70-456(-)
MDTDNNKQFLMDGQKYKHPGIRRASWNPEVPENVAGRLIPKPRKASCASLDLPLRIKRHSTSSCEMVAENNSEPENQSSEENEALKISSGKQVFIPNRKTVSKEDNSTDIEIDVPERPELTIAVLLRF